MLSTTICFKMIQIIEKKQYDNWSKLVNMKQGDLF